MRRLRDDSGGLTVLFGVLVVALFLPLMLVVADYGRVIFERRQVQNSADAAAFAVAFDCARAVMNRLPACTAASTMPTAATYANANDTADGDTKVQAIAPVTVTRNGVNIPGAKVTTRSREEGSESIGLWVAGYLNPAQARARVEAEATAIWGGAATGKGVPLIMQRCSFDTFGGAAPFAPGGPFPPDSAAPTIVLNKPQPPCGEPEHPSGSHGWLEPQIGACEISLGVGLVVIATHTGNSPSCNYPGGAGSQAASVQAQLYHNNYTNLVYIPIVTEHTGTGAGGDYIVEGWSAMYVTGWNFGGQFEYQSGNPKCGTSDNSARCIRGFFVNAPPKVGGVGGGSFGVQNVQLVK